MAEKLIQQQGKPLRSGFFDKEAFRKKSRSIGRR